MTDQTSSIVQGFVGCHCSLGLSYPELTASEQQSDVANMSVFLLSQALTIIIPREIL